MKNLVLKIVDHPDILMDFTEEYLAHHFSKSKYMTKQ